MNRVLIIGPHFHYFNASVERAFRALGYETRVLAYDNPVHPYTLYNKIRYKFAGDKLAMKRASRSRFSVEADAVFAQYQPDVVFVMNGDMLEAEMIRRWRGRSTVNGQQSTVVGQRSKVALWFFDSMTHIPLCEDNITAVDAVWCYEQTDIPLIRERYGVEAHFLPQSVDLSLYHRTEGVEKRFDIVFAGDMVHSQKRREVVQAVVAHYPHQRIRVWGEYKPWYKNPWTWLTRERRDIYQNCNASAAQLCEDYNASRLVLNIHHEQQRDGANPKVYEIAATGTYQVCDANPYIEQLFPHGELGLYHLPDGVGEEHRYDDLFARIDEALTQDRSAQAEAARQVILTGHTFEQRMAEVIGQLIIDN